MKKSEACSHLQEIKRKVVNLIVFKGRAALIRDLQYRINWLELFKTTERNYGIIVSPYKNFLKAAKIMAEDKRRLKT